MARPRKQTYTLKMYLGKMKDGDIDNSADVQRKFVWKSEQINGLIRTVLTDDYIPPIILGEEDNTQLHIADGGQRSAALKLFRYGNYKITSSIEDSVIEYKRKSKDKNGKVIWEDVEFDIKNKTFELLPDELKKKFDEYQIDTVIHEHCDRKKISKYIKIYNQQISMNASQKAYTYIYNFAEYINSILKNKFFVDYSSFTELEKIKGVTERVVLETVMCMYHIDKWKKQTKQIAQYLNENCSKEEFEKLDNNLHRLENIITNDVKDLFNSKNCFIWLTLFNRFVELGMDDTEFLKFLHAFKAGLKDKVVDGQVFDEVDKIKSTKDKAVVISKLHILESLMKEFLCIKENQEKQVDVEAFIAENLDLDIERVKEDMDLYNESLDTLLEDTVRIDSKLRKKENRLSLLAMMAYSYKEDVDLDEWMIEYAKNNNFFYPKQEENYLYMKQDFDRFILNK
ncbi:MAG: DUF262 domain-containing protein [Lachnospiraceae bacterium]|nr:DUF262 domain-containing protein [Lachnospiraceae bacterium]